MVLFLSPLPLSSIVSLSFTCLPLAFLLKVAHYHFPLLYTWAFHFGQSQNVLNCICTQSTAFIMHYISSPLSPTTREHCFLLCSDGLIGYSHTEKWCSLLRTHLVLLYRYMGMLIYLCRILWGHVSNTFGADPSLFGCGETDFPSSALSLLEKVVWDNLGVCEIWYGSQLVWKQSILIHSHVVYKDIF